MIRIPVEAPVTEYLHSKAARLGIPLSGTFELSPVCNFTCRMCYVRKTAKEVRESPRGILTLADWRRIAREAPAHLHPGGMVFLEVGWDQGENVRQLMEAAGFTQTMVHHDLQGIPRMVEAHL